MCLRTIYNYNSIEMLRCKILFLSFKYLNISYWTLCVTQFMLHWLTSPHCHSFTVLAKDRRKSYSAPAFVTTEGSIHPLLSMVDKIASTAEGGPRDYVK